MNYIRKRFFSYSCAYDYSYTNLILKITLNIELSFKDIKHIIEEWRFLKFISD